MDTEESEFDRSTAPRQTMPMEFLEYESEIINNLRSTLIE
jgi:hypothetical protein